MNNYVRSPLVPALSLGAAAVDARLSSGLIRAALHEVYSAAGDVAAAAFALLLALRTAAEGVIVYIRDDRCVRDGGRLYACGITELGGDPARFVIIHAADTLAVLRAAADAVTCSAVIAVIVEPWAVASAFDLTASRRLALRAERSGVLTLVVRTGEPVPSAAATRWQVAAVPSAALAANAPGQPAFNLTLLRHRSGVAGFTARVEWNRDQCQFADPPLPRRVPAVVAGRARDTNTRRAA